jgi:hypothetical protein
MSDDRPAIPLHCALHDKDGAKMVPASRMQHFTDGKLGNEEITYPCGCTARILQAGHPSGWRLYESRQLT